MRTFCNKNRVSFTLGVYQYTYKYQALYFILVVSTVHSIVKRKVNVLLQYFCHDALHSNCCGGRCSLLPPSSTKELVDFLLFYFIFALKAFKPWCCYTSNCSKKRKMFQRKNMGSHCRHSAKLALIKAY